MLYTSITHTNRGNYQLNHNDIAGALEEIFALGDVKWSKIIRVSDGVVVEEYFDGQLKEADKEIGQFKVFLQNNIDSIDESKTILQNSISNHSSVPVIVSVGESLKKLDAEKAILLQVKGWLEDVK